MSSITCGWMPKRAAWSRSMVSVSVVALGLLVGRDVAQFGSVFSLSRIFGAQLVQLVEVGVLQRVLVLRARRAAADVDVLRRLQEELRALDLVELGPQPGDDLIGGALRSFARLQGDEEAAGVERELPPPAPIDHGDVGDRRVRQHDLAELLLEAHHLGERDVLRRLRDAGDEAGVLLREEALGDDDEQIRPIAPAWRGTRTA